MEGFIKLFKSKQTLPGLKYLDTLMIVNDYLTVISLKLKTHQGF